MPLSHREMAIAAQQTHEWLKTLRESRFGDIASKLGSVLSGMGRLETLGRRLRLCTSRHWPTAAAEVSDRLSDCLRWIVRDIEKTQNSANRSSVSIPSVSDIAADLWQAESEFGQLRHDRKAAMLSVTTEAIRLDDVYLGEFEIQLQLSMPGESAGNKEMFRVVALDPHPAASDNTVTHPHLRDEQLCAGDAATAIQSALSQGRICDFFLLVKSVLSQYNSASPYVSLANWESGACYDCGCSFGGGAYYTCPACENDFCTDCMSYCRRCDNSYCQECLTTCSVCDESICVGCITRCPDCRKAICKTCLEENQCPCQQEKENDHEPSSRTVAKAAV